MKLLFKLNLSPRSQSRSCGSLNLFMKRVQYLHWTLLRSIRFKITARLLDAVTHINGGI